MKKLALSLLILLTAVTGAGAKIVKFSVDMTGTTLSGNGLHVMGDFQAAAGYAGGDFQAAATSLLREGTTQIYSVTVKVPPFKAYQFKYVNGNQFYDAEFVPAESRVNAILNDNRWIYVDSLNADTMKLAAVIYGTNAPAGLSLLRFRVDLRNVLPAAATGAHVAGGFQGTDPAKTRLYSWSDSVYEYITYVSNGTYDYKYYSSNTAASAETVPTACAVSGNRSIIVTSDIVLNIVCFSSCSACPTSATGVSTVTTGGAAPATIAPNPVTEQLTVSFNDTRDAHMLMLTDAAGRVVRRVDVGTEKQVIMARGSLPAGFYYLKITTAGSEAFTKKIILR